MADFLSVVIPAYNEEKNLERIEGELLPVMKKIKSKYEIIIIDDGSKDKTHLVAANLAKKYKTIRVIKHPKNMGLAEATRTGIKNIRGNVAVFLDSDFTFHPREMPKLYNKFKKTGCDCVVGSQFNKYGSTEMPFYRLFLSKSVNTMYRIMLGQKVSTISSIFRLYRTEPLKKLKLESSGFNICAEILVKMILEKKHIEEVPVTLTTRIHGESKINNRKEFVNHLKMLSSIAKWNIKERFNSSEDQRLS